MTRKRYVYTEGGIPLPEPYEVGAEWRNKGNETGHKSEEEIYGKLQATDGTDISTRRRHREYMRANNLTVSEDFKGTWAKAQSERDAFRSGESHQHKREVREAVERAAYAHERKNRNGR